MIYCVNQLGGVGAPSKMFATTADGSAVHHAVKKQKLTIS